MSPALRLLLLAQKGSRGGICLLSVNKGPEARSAYLSASTRPAVQATDGLGSQGSFT